MIRKLALAVAVVLLAVGLPAVAAAPALADKPRGSGGGQTGKPPPGQLPKHKSSLVCYVDIGHTTYDLLVDTSALGTFGNTTIFDAGNNCTVPVNIPAYLDYAMVSASASLPTESEADAACSNVVLPTGWSVKYTYLASLYWGTPIGWVICQFQYIAP